MNRPKTLCMAPWVHTYLSPQTERRMCCASREPAQNFGQYIDTKSGTGRYIPITLDEHWNSEHMKSVRRRMMAGEEMPECEVCHNKLLNTDVYRSYFNQLFNHKYDEAMALTDETGYTTMKPVSWDYRFSNLCNFKCRTCGDMLSSSWEAEERQHGTINWDDSKNNWMIPEIKEKITAFQDSQIEAEFSQAVEEHFTLTLPGLFEIENMQNLAKELDVDILAKVIFSFSPNIIFSPLAMPRRILDRVINELEPLATGAMQDVLVQLKHRPTFEEQWPDTYKEGLALGKRSLLNLENIRKDKFTLGDILKQDPEIYEWYQNIAT